MAQGSQVNKSKLKRDLDQLGKDLYIIDLQVQRIKQGQQQGNIPTLEQEKLDIQKQVVAKEVELTKLNAQTRAARRGRR